MRLRFLMYEILCKQPTYCTATLHTSCIDNEVHSQACQAGLHVLCMLLNVLQIGISPDWEVDPATLPTDKQGLCSAVYDLKQAPKLFGDAM